MADKVRIAELETAYTANLDHLKKGAQDAERIVNESSSRMSKVFSGALSVAAGNLLSNAISKLTSGFTDLIGRGIGLNEQIERAQINFTTLSGNVKAATSHIEELRKMSIATGFDMPSLLTASDRLQVFGFNIKQTTSLLRAAQDQAAAFGNADSFDRIVQALGLMAEKGQVAARQVMLLERQGVPAMKYLAEATGLSVKQLKELEQAGRLRGDVAARLIGERIESRFGGLAERQARETAFGRRQAFENIGDIRVAQGTQSLTSEIGLAYSKGYEALSGPGGEKFAENMNAMTARFFGFLNKGIAAFAGGDITGAMTQLGKDAVDSFWGGITSTGGKLIDAGKGAASNIVTGIKDELQMHSPSRVMMELGFEAGMSFRMGFARAMQQDGEGYRPTAAMRNYANLTSREPGFEGKLAQVAKAIGIDPNWLLNVMGVETVGTFKPSIQNPDTHATGLIQFMPSTAQGLGTSIDALKRMTATEQLDYVQKYFQPFAGRLKSQADVYSVVAKGSDVPEEGPDRVIYRKGEAGYAKNQRLWDVDRNGIIQAFELGDVASRMGFGKPGSVSSFAPTGFQYPDEPKPPVAPTLLADPQREKWKVADSINYTPDQLKDYSASIRDVAERIDALFTQTGTEDLTGRLNRFESGKPDQSDTMNWNAFVGIQGYTASDLQDPKLLQQLSSAYQTDLKQEIAYRQKVLDTQAANLKATEDYQRQLEEYQQRLATYQQQAASRPSSPDIPTEWNSVTDFINKINPEGLSGGAMPSPISPDLSLLDTDKFFPRMTADTKDFTQAMIELGVGLPPVLDDLSKLNDLTREGAHVPRSQQKENLKALVRESDEASRGASQAFENSFDDAFNHINEGFKATAATFIVDFAKAILQMEEQALAAQLAKRLFGGTQPTEEGSSRGWLGGILNLIFGGIANRIGGGGGSGAGASTGATANGLSIAPGMTLFGHHAQGGFMQPGEWSWIGERGPELAKAGPLGLSVLSNQDSKRMMSGQQSGQIVNIYNLNFKSSAPNSYYPKPSEREFAENIMKLLRGGL